MILKIFSKIFSRIFKNILKIFPQKQSQKQSKSMRVWFMLSHLHPPIFLYVCHFLLLFVYYFHIFLSSQFCLYVPFFCVFSLPTLSPSFICFVLKFLSFCQSPFLSSCVSLDGACLKVWQGLIWTHCV